jgi:hypothetical protein
MSGFSDAEKISFVRQILDDDTLSDMTNAQILEYFNSKYGTPSNSSKVCFDEEPNSEGVAYSPSLISREVEK